MTQTERGVLIMEKIATKKESFKKWWRKTWKIITTSPTHCLVCGKPLMFNNSHQLVKYCSKECRHKRHNKKR